MKKLILLLAALILVSGLCFAQDEGTEQSDKPEFFDLEVTIGFPVHWTNSATKHEPLSDKTVTADTAIGAALLFNFSKKFGLTLDTDFFYGGTLFGVTGNDSDSATLFGVNVLLGPVIYLYNGTFLRIPLALGVHMYYWSQDQWLANHNNNATGDWRKTRDLQLGPGAYLGVQFHFNDNIYIFSRTNVAIDMFRWHSEKGSLNAAEYSNSEMEFGLGWMVKPAVGIGVKF